MATFKTFEEIEAWRKARELTKRIYAVSGVSAFAIMSNIAEGYDRGGTAEFIQFLAIAKGSTAEVKCQLYVALDQNYIDRRTFTELSGLAMETGNMIGGLMKYLRHSGIKG